MKKHRWTMLGVLALLAWFFVGAGLVQAQNRIYPVDPATFAPDTSSPVWITLTTPSGVDITHSWTPALGEVVIGVNLPVGDYSISLDPSTTADPTNPASPDLSTSGYPGECTNYGDPTDVTADFTLAAGNILTPNDCGGIAVLTVTPDGGAPIQFVVPQDTDFDGNYDICEREASGSVTGLARNEDNDIGPGGSGRIGDAIAAIDECRGFMVDGVKTRFDPRVKDVLAHFVETFQCVADATLIDHHGSLMSLGSFYDNVATPADDPDFDDLFVAANTLVPEMKIHYLVSGEWEDNFSSYDPINRVTLSGTSPQNAVTDRQINKNALEPLGRLDTASGMTIMKGIRLVQCLKTSGSTMGLCPKRPLDGFREDDGTCVVFPQTIWSSFKNKFQAGWAKGDNNLLLYTFESNKWRLQNTWGPPPADDPTTTFSDYFGNTGVRSIMRDWAIPFYVAHEVFGHGLDLTLTLEGTRRVSYGYHHSDGAGTLIDVRITQQIKGDANKFYIPKSFGSFDLEDMRLLQSH